MCRRRETEDGRRSIGEVKEVCVAQRFHCGLCRCSAVRCGVHEHVHTSVAARVEGSVFRIRTAICSV
jgi:hypothetical protein